MRSGQIQHAINHGVAPFALCRIVSCHIRTSHKRGDHIQDSIGAVFHSLPQRTAMPKRDSCSPFASVLAASGNRTANAMEAMLANSMEASMANAIEAALVAAKRASTADATEATNVA